MMKNFNIKNLGGFLFKDIGWKLISLLSAVLLWVVVSNIVDPLKKNTYYRTISYSGKEVLAKNGFIIDGEDKLPSNVRLSIQAKLSDLNKLLDPSIATATVDLSKIDSSYNERLGEPISLPINLNIPAAYSVMDKDPESVSIKLDRIISELKTVEVIPIGSVKEGYQNMPSSYRDTVEITGPQTVIDTIDSVRTEISVKNADKDILINEAELRVYDSNNADITDSVVLSAEKIQIRIPVYPIKSVPVKARIRGNPKQGYWVSDFGTSPEAVDIVGPADLLAEMDVIELEPVQVNDASADITKDFNVWDYLKDTKLSVRNGGVFNVSVAVHIQEEETKRLTLPIGNIAIIRDNSQMVPQLPPDPITVTIRGPVDAIGAIYGASLRAELDLSGLPAGIHDVPLHFALPSNVTVANAPIKLRIVLIDESAAPEESGQEPDESPSPPAEAPADAGEDGGSAPTRAALEPGASETPAP